KEHQALLHKGDRRLGRTRQWWLMRPEKLTPERKEEFDRLVASQLKAARAWTAKRLFASFWKSPNLEAAPKFFNVWYRRVIRSRIPQLKAVAKMLRSHLERLLNYIVHPITNAVYRGLQLKNPSPAPRRPWLPQLQQLPSSYPVLLWKTFALALTKPLPNPTLNPEEPTRPTTQVWY